MSYPPEFLVTEIDLNAPFEPSTDLGVNGVDEALRDEAAKVNSIVNEALTDLRFNAAAAYLIQWTSDLVRSPRGANVGGHIIAATRHGFVLANEANGYAPEVGAYHRIKDQDGPNRDENLMAVFLRDQATPKQG